MHIRSIQILVLRKPSGDGNMQKSTAFDLCLSTGQWRSKGGPWGPQAPGGALRGAALR